MRARERERLEFSRQKEDELAFREMVSGGNWEDMRSERKKDENGEKVHVHKVKYTRTQASIGTVIRNT
ncbi:hypothetical protein ALC53_01451 [Atta colombica]|uniref:Uncharacterized protein n=1 Tax=Atta colombica TaxID=520822 RepID=A0A195BV88_9HYME|nr:hypothetical protein ALC53_01451 [Atta colombica]